MYSILIVIPLGESKVKKANTFVKRHYKINNSLKKYFIIKYFLLLRPNSIISFYTQIKRYNNIIKKYNPDLVVSQYGSYTSLFVVLFSKNNKICISFRGTDINPDPYSNIIQLKLTHLMSHISSIFANGIICVSEELASRLIINKKFIIIPTPTYIDHFRPLNITDCRKKLNWGQDKIILSFFCGNNSIAKGIHLAEHIKKIIGTRDGNIEVKLFYEEISYYDMPIYLNASNCLLYLSKYEGSPNLIRDACACNIPIITTDVGDVKEILNNVDVKLVINNDFINSIDKIINFSYKAKRSNSRDYIKNNYSVQQIVNKTSKYYLSIINS